MKNTILILIVLNLLCCKKKELSLKDYCYDFNLNNLHERLSSAVKKSNTKIQYQTDTIIYREIVNGYSEDIVILTKNIQNDTNKYLGTEHNYLIKTVSKGNHIVYYEIAIQGVQEDEIIAKDTNKNQLSHLVESYRYTYDMDLDLKKLFNTSVVYGNSCTIIVEPPLERLKQIQFIQNNDTTKIIEWLKSPTLELQLYAIDAIYKLEKTGTMFSNRVKKIISIIERKEGMVHCCLGCQYYYDDISKIIPEIKQLN